MLSFFNNCIKTHGNNSQHIIFFKLKHLFVNSCITKTHKVKRICKEANNTQPKKITSKNAIPSSLLVCNIGGCPPPIRTISRTLIWSQTKP